MLERYLVKLSSTFYVAAGLLVALCKVASAETSDDPVLKKLAALEARVEALEAKNQDYRREAEQARAQAREANQKLAKLSPALLLHSKPAPTSAYASYLTGQTPQTWTGLYWGASAGGAATRSSTTSLESFTEESPPFVSGVRLLGTSGPAKGAGGLINVFAGWNTQVDRFVFGGEFEATYSDLNFSSTGTKAYTYFTQNGPTGQTAVGDYRPQVLSRWMGSVLLRAGVLLDDKTLLYGIAGWTIASFEARNVTENPFYQPTETFWANGWTAGAGLERKLDSNWSMRAEYRYTSFGTARVSDRFSWQEASPVALVQTEQRQTQFMQSMQAGQIGFAYAFNPLK
jgi:outer membrane immunogenic protein